jgi:hypothetical protein
MQLKYIVRAGPPEKTLVEDQAEVYERSVEKIRKAEYPQLLGRPLPLR